MAINLAEDAVHALNRAAAAAAREGSEAVSPTHILAGTLSHGDPVLTRVLETLDLELEAVPEGLRDAPPVYGGHLPFTPPAHAVLAAAIDHAGRAGGPGAPTACAHLLMGVARTGDADTQAVLAEWGLDADALAEAVDEELCSVAERSSENPEGTDPPAASPDQGLCSPAEQSPDDHIRSAGGTFGGDAPGRANHGLSAPPARGEAPAPNLIVPGAPDRTGAPRISIIRNR